MGINKRRGFRTYKEAKKYLELRRITRPHATKGWNIYDLKRTHPRRKATRYFVGNYYEWLEQ